MRTTLASLLAALSIGSAAAQEQAQLPRLKPLSAEEQARLSPPYSVTKGPGVLPAVRVVMPPSKKPPLGYDNVPDPPTPRSWQWMMKRNAER